MWKKKRKKSRDAFFSLHHVLDDLSAGVNPGKFSTMESTKAMDGVSLESPIACYSLSLSPASANPLHPAIMVGLLSRDPLARTGAWKPQTCPLACLSARRFKKKKGKKKKGREQLCSWLHLPASVISIHCECKQTEP